MIFGYPRFHAVDLNTGALLAAGKVYFYLAGTTTPHNSYADAALGTPNTNPVELDGGGEATIFLDPAIAYKVVLADAYDVVIWTVDGVQTPEALTVDTLDVTGAVSVGGNLDVAGTVTANKLVVADSTEVANLNAATLKGKTWAAPDPIGATTPASGSFTTLAASGNETVGGTQDVTGNVTQHANLIRQSANGAQWVKGQVSELLTIAAAATTDSVANLLPATSIIEAVVVRTIVTIPTAATYTVGDPTQAARFATGVGVSAGSTGIGILHWNPAVASDDLGSRQVAAAKIRITPSAQPGDASGQIRITIFYRQFVAPTS